MDRVRRARNVDPYTFRGTYMVLSKSTTRNSLLTAYRFALSLGQRIKDSKICPKCKKDKHISNFGRDAVRDGGLRNNCRSCVNRMQLKRDVKKRNMQRGEGEQ